MQTSLLDRGTTSPVLPGCEQSTGSRATIDGTTGTLFCSDGGIAVHIWSEIEPDRI